VAIPAEPDKLFFRPQKLIYGHLSDPFFSYSAPTSMGKSFVMRMFIKRQIQEGGQFNYALIVPTKALVNEVSSRILHDLEPILKARNYSVVTAAGALALEEEHNFIYVLTPERLLYLMIRHPNKPIDYLFIDEAHKITSKDKRSAFYYKDIDMLAQRERKPRVIFASPNIPNPEVYLKLVPEAMKLEDLSSMRVATKFSPVSQVKYLVDCIEGNIRLFNDRTGQFIDIDRAPISDQFSGIIRKWGQDVQTIVYFNSKDKAIQAAIDFSSRENDKGDAELNALAKEIESQVHKEYFLAQLIRHGVAYHIGYLPAAIRMKIEKLFRDKKIVAMFCTSTLVEGVNLPADNLFITTYRKGRGQTKMTAVDFRNLVGRVGRIDHSLYGNVFLVRLEENLKVKDFVELLEKPVKEQKLSLLTELKPKQKQKIVECLLQGTTNIEKDANQSQDSFDLTRKFCLILLRDIMKGRNSIVKHAFEKFLTPEDEAKIKAAFETDEIVQDDDINTSVDQTKRLHVNIAYGLSYPEMDDEGRMAQGEPQAFLEKLFNVFEWGKCENHETIGNFNRLRWYAVILRQWMSGYGLGMIIASSLNYASTAPSYKVRIGGNLVDYDHSSMFHRNLVMSETLQAIENVILFSISNYFLKFSEAYKRIHNIEGELENDWYEFVEYGTNKPLPIFLQRNGFSHEAALYIRDHARTYVVDSGDRKYQLKNGLFLCGNISVVTEAEDIRINNPDLFVD
jgi:superfamily II DNA/RNA helicase